MLYIVHYGTETVQVTEGATYVQQGDHHVGHCPRF